MGAVAVDGAVADGRDGPAVLWPTARECKVVTGIDDHSRFVVCAKVVARATARPVCAALQEALGRHGVPEQILTDNGKVFTARFGLGPGPVMFDRMCNDNGIRHLLTAPYSPTTTGKVERLHKTIRAEFLAEHDRAHATDRGRAGGAGRVGGASTTPSGRTSPAVVGRRPNGSRSPTAASIADRSTSR